MGLLSAVLDHDRVLYIMTLGVLEGHRHRGLASTLISIACQHAYESRWVQQPAQPCTYRADLCARAHRQAGVNSNAWS